MVQSEYAETLAYIARHGEAALYQRPARRHSGRLHEGAWRLHRAARISPPTRPSSASPIRADYRGWEILGPPPPAASGVHIAQMLNILEGYDIAGMGFGTAETIHLLAEVLKIAFADRAAASGDPDYRQGAGGAADLEGLCRTSAAARSIRRARRQWGAGVAAARRRAHHAHDGGGCVGQRGRDHADHQQSVRREDS